MERHKTSTGEWLGLAVLVIIYWYVGAAGVAQGAIFMVRPICERRYTEHTGLARKVTT